MVLALAAIGALIALFEAGDRETREVTYQQPTAWVVSRASGELVEINGATGDVSARVTVAEPRARIEVTPIGDAVAVHAEVVLLHGKPPAS